MWVSGLEPVRSVPIITNNLCYGIAPHSQTELDVRLPISPYPHFLFPYFYLNFPIFF